MRLTALRTDVSFHTQSLPGRDQKDKLRAAKAYLHKQCLYGQFLVAISCERMGRSSHKPAVLIDTWNSVQEGKLQKFFRFDSA